MERHDNLVIMGQDIASHGGAFKITDGLNLAKNVHTPLSESAVFGNGIIDQRLQSYCRNAWLSGFNRIQL
jgi:hypothetical protein